MRVSVIASAAAVGAVATGSVAALFPASSSAATAVADEAPSVGSLSSSTAAMLRNPNTQAVGTLAPVAVDGLAAADQHLAMLGKATDIAAQIAQAHEKEAERARIGAVVASGGLDGWIAQALQVLDLPQNLAPGVKKIIMAESGGNPRAINLTDSNALRGTPSQGLMQTIPTTYRHYVAPQLANRPITDPVANITAGVSYMVDNYGVNTVAAGGRTNAVGNYIGY
ncbi:MAG: transglycosylase SLT domain-containing protein [Pseudonocardia sp.]|nr:transglycosylase SLT domain-containing protein [Pseudonocardia sp.]